VADQSSQRPGQAPWPAQYPALKQRYHVQTQFNPALRAATADRERTVDVLKAGFAEGRLTQDEYNERMSRAYEAKTYGELTALTADLPAGALPFPVPQPQLPQWQPPGPPLRVRTNSMAILSMVLGLAEFPTFGLTAIPAVVAGHRARQEMRRTGEQGDGMATFGLVLGYLGIIAWTLIVLVGAAVMLRHSSHAGFPAHPGPP
jgi:hypothetical protein